MYILKKADRKIERKIVRALTDICNCLKPDTEGFSWLTHFVDYANASNSLRIVCVFDTDQALNRARDAGFIQRFPTLAKNQLETEGLDILHIEKVVYFDTVENGADVSDTRWCRKYAR